MPKAFSYRLRLSGNFIRTFNIVILNCIMMQGAVAQSFGTGEVHRTARRVLKGEKMNHGGESAGILVGGRSLAEVNVGYMNGLFNTVSNEVSYVDNTGSSIMANGDSAILAVGPYKCSEGTCASIYSMLATLNLYGEVKCVEDSASCILDGEDLRRGLIVDKTGSDTLILRALSFVNGAASSGGGVYIMGASGAYVDIELCVFSNCRASGYVSGYGGGAIYVSNNPDSISVYVYGTSFHGNTADTGEGNDIHNKDPSTDDWVDDDQYAFGFDSYSTIFIYSTCPSPYSSSTPIQGEPWMGVAQFKEISPH